MLHHWLEASRGTPKACLPPLQPLTVSTAKLFDRLLSGWRCCPTCCWMLHPCASHLSCLSQQTSSHKKANWHRMRSTSFRVEMFPDLLLDAAFICVSIALPAACIIITKEYTVSTASYDDASMSHYKFHEKNAIQFMAMDCMFSLLHHLTTKRWPPVQISTCHVNKAS